MESEGTGEDHELCQRWVCSLPPDYSCVLRTPLFVIGLSRIRERALASRQEQEGKEEEEEEEEEEEKEEEEEEEEEEEKEKKEEEAALSEEEKACSESSLSTVY